METNAKRTAAEQARLYFVAFILALILGIGGYWWWSKDLQTTDDAQLDADVIALSVRIGGQVDQVLVADNQAVKAGDIILMLDPNDQAMMVAQSEAELKVAMATHTAALSQVAVVEAAAAGGLQSAKASVSGSSVAVSSARAQVAAAQAAVARAQADAHKTQLDFNRAVVLHQQAVISEERFENAQTAKEAAEAMLAQATANLKAATQTQIIASKHVDEAEGHLRTSTPIAAQLAAATANAEVAAAHVEAAKAKLNLQKLMQSYLSLTAPLDGTITKLSAHPGALLQAGQAVAELVPHRFYVTANFKETQTGCMRPGQSATITLDAKTTLSLQGTVESLAQGTGARFSLLPPDNASGNFVKVVQRVPVRIKLLDIPSDMPLRVGLSATVTVNCK